MWPRADLAKDGTCTAPLRGEAEIAGLVPLVLLALSRPGVFSNAAGAPSSAEPLGTAGLSCAAGSGLACGLLLLTPRGLEEEDALVLRGVDDFAPRGVVPRADLGREIPSAAAAGGMGRKSGATSAFGSN